MKFDAVELLGRCNAVSQLKQLLTQAKRDGTPIRAIVFALAPSADDDDVRREVFDALVNQPEDAEELSYRLQIGKAISWQQRWQEFSNVLARSEIEPEDLNARAIVTAIRQVYDEPGRRIDFSRIAGLGGLGGPPGFGGPTLVPSEVELAKHFIGEAINKENDTRMLAYIKAILMAIASGSQARVGRWINEYQTENENSVPPDKLLTLRTLVGGTEAVAPLLQKKVEVDLDTKFQGPINEVNSLTMQMWADTINAARLGLTARMVVSIAVFIVGLLLLAISGYKILWGTMPPGSAELLIGPGETFLAGLAMTLLVVYSGPLKEIKHSMSDLGVASACFTAFTHRIL